VLSKRAAQRSRCEPPPEFPPASPCAGIVHRLSGPNGRAPTRSLRACLGGGDTSPRPPVRVGRWCFQSEPRSVRACKIPLISHLLIFTFVSHSARRFDGDGVFSDQNARAYVRLLGPCYKTGRSRPFSAKASRTRIFFLTLQEGSATEKSLAAPAEDCPREGREYKGVTPPSQTHVNPTP